MGGFLPSAERRSTALLAIYTVVSLLLLVVGDRLPQGWLRGTGAQLFGPLDHVVLLGDRLGSAWRESRVLHQRIAMLELENAELRPAGVENDSLRRTLGLPVRGPYEFAPVEVLSLSGTPVPVAATLSAGRNRGLDVGDAVVTQQGLLGRIAECYSNASRVTLLTDPVSVVACEVESTGVHGLLRATTAPYPRLILTSVPLADTVQVGQRVLTSGMSRRFPRHLVVGHIARIGREQTGLTQEIEIEPGARLSTLRHAFVLRGSHRDGDLP
jgi:rod shape-determining protein MreC